MPAVPAHGESVRIVHGVEHFAGLAVAGDVPHAACDGRLYVVNAGCGKIHAAMPVAGEVVGTGKGPPVLIGAQGAQLLAARVDFDNGVAVVAGNQPVFMPGKQATGTAACAMPEYDRLRTVPALDVAGRVFDVEELP